MQELFNKICKNQSLNIIVSAPLNAYMESLVSWEAIVYVMSRHLASQIKHFANKFSIQYNLAQVGREDNFITVGNNHNLQNFYKMDKVRNQNLGRQQKTDLVNNYIFQKQSSDAPHSNSMFSSHHQKDTQCQTQGPRE